MGILFGVRGFCRGFSWAGGGGKSGWFSGFWFGLAAGGMRCRRDPHQNMSLLGALVNIQLSMTFHMSLEILELYHFLYLYQNNLQVYILDGGRGRREVWKN